MNIPPTIAMAYTKAIITKLRALFCLILSIYPPLWNTLISQNRYFMLLFWHLKVLMLSFYLQNVFLYGVGDTVWIIVQSHLVTHSLYIIGSIAHGYTQPRPFKHWHVIVAITNCHSFRSAYTKNFGKLFNGDAFAAFIPLMLYSIILKRNK